MAPKTLVHVMGWFGDGNIHRQVSYLSNDPAVIARQIRILKFAKINNQPISGVILTWQGPSATFLHSAVTQWCTLCAQNGLLFCLLMDPWISHVGGTTPSTASVTQALNDPTSQAMFNSPAYVPEKFILDDNVLLTNPVPPATWTPGNPGDWTTLASQFPSLTFLHNASGFSWPSVDMTIINPWSRIASSVTNLQGQNSNVLMKIPGFGVRFDDSGMPTPQGVALSAWTGTRDYNTTVWGPSGSINRVLDDDAGKLIFDQLAVTPTTTPYVAAVTWNDYDEGTAIEPFFAMWTGIRIGS